ncbi:hypothetical protein [Streptomyces flaveolus]|uniref:hypothetical protein n=1 Tax=Streptomyces flaveolus TaxID=67297 RepID=UPI0034486B2E
MSTTAAALTTLAVVLGLPAVWCHGYRTCRQVAAARAAQAAEQAARPPGPHAAAVADEIALGWQQLLEACCLRGWDSAGAEHDTTTCTRKDHHA